MREFAISIYLLGFKLLFSIFKLFPLKNKVTFLISFSENFFYIYEEMEKQNINIQTIFLCNPRTFPIFEKMGVPTYLLETTDTTQAIKNIYHLATSKHIIADNYYGLLAATKFKRAVTCTQIWHSVGAIKQFGALDPTNSTRTAAANKRFHKVYNRFDQFVIGSDFMGDIFKKAMPAPNATFLKTGVPRTDFFFNEARHEEARQYFHRINPFLSNKKIILYAPTFRNDEKSNDIIPLDLKKMHTAFRDDYILIVKRHPASIWKLDEMTRMPYFGFLFDYSNDPYVNDLLVLADILITDYSSLPMEFIFRKKKMIFYAYDLESYQLEAGLWEDYESSVPGPVVRDTDEVIEAVLDAEIDHSQFDDYAKKWIQYCDGKSSERLVKKLFAND